MLRLWGTVVSAALLGVLVSVCLYRWASRRRLARTAALEMPEPSTPYTLDG